MSIFSIVDGLKLIVIHHQQVPPHLGFYSSRGKGWIATNITLEQDIIIRLLLAIPALWDSMCLS